VFISDAVMVASAKPTPVFISDRVMMASVKPTQW
jgi:bifunctional DNase/RNase